MNDALNDEEVSRLGGTVVMPSGCGVMQIEGSVQGQFPPYLSANSRRLWSKCPRLFYERKIMQVVEPGISPDAHAGKAFAAGACEWRASAGSLPAAWEAFCTEWGTYEPPEDHVKQKDRVWKAFESSTRRWPIGDDWLSPIRCSHSTKAVEWPFAIALPHKHPDTGKPIYYVGIVDMAAHDREGRVWVEDDKTARSLGRDWEARYRLSSAQIGYVWGLKQYGLEVYGYTVRGTQIAKTKCDHSEVVEVVPPWRLDAWYDRLLDDVGAMLGMYAIQREDAWPQRGMENEACGDFGGCALIDVCSSRNPARTRALYCDRGNGSVRGGIFDPLLEGK